MKTASDFPIYCLPGADKTRLLSALDGLGLELRSLDDASEVHAPALLVLDDGQVAPKDWEPWSVTLPSGVSGSAVRELVNLGMQNAVLKAQLHDMERQARRHEERFQQLNEIGVALSSERDIDKLQEMILRVCRQLTKADGASLYLLEEDGHTTRFAAAQNHSLEIPFSSFTMPLTEKSMFGYTMITGKSQMVVDAYNLPEGTPFSFNRAAVDDKYGYRTKSQLCVPMRNHEGEVVGAIQLLNAKRHSSTVLTSENVDQEVVSFREGDLNMIESIASQAAVALDNKRLLDSIQQLFGAFVNATVTAIEQRDPITSGHSRRVEAYTMGIARAVNELGAGKYRDILFNADQLKELSYACLLHDFGKVGVSEQILQKARKLYPGQLELIQQRFDYVLSTIRERYANEKLGMALEHGGLHPEKLIEMDRRRDAELAKLQNWIDEVTAADKPSVLDEDKASMLQFLAEKVFTDPRGQNHPLLTPQEFRFLSIKKGTFDEAERREMEEHVTKSFRFLVSIPWTKDMANIPQIAYGHHEYLDGSGYPRKLVAEQIPIQARMMTISDIYDALTAKDRPYKPAVPVERALGILKAEADHGKLDVDLLDIFIVKKVYDVDTSAFGFVGHKPE